jgi:hypothetical protein
MDWKTKKPATPPTPDLVPLPMGMADFHNWADVIISQTGMTATVDSQKFVLANLILELPPIRMPKKMSTLSNACARWPLIR